MRLKPSLSILLLFVCGLIFAQSAQATPSAEALARLALSENVSESGPAISALRGMGPAGLRAMFEVYRSEIERHALDTSALKDSTPEWRRLTAALDAVSQQRDSYAAGLYWYTDFDEAKRAAAESGKPILSLRLLGNLNEEFSCANSRFFRAVLYSNREVSDALRSRFILHWKSVRPAPRVTIDFGDGRKLERTLTGNSIHYILDSQGRTIDALPGLYGPKAFLRGLAQAEGLLKQMAGQTETARIDLFYRYHRTRINLTAAEWAADVQKIGGHVPDTVLARVSARRQNPSAIEIAPVAMTKRAVEIDFLKAMTTDARELEAATSDAAWAKIAALHAGDARLDERSIAFIRRQSPAAPEIVNRAKAPVPDQLTRIVENLERNMALDTVRNEYVLHNRIHAWLGNFAWGQPLETFNEKVYAELFLTPSSDPWLGLYSPDNYTALENGGVVKQ
ncbi:MAG TPA: hypothetical protein VF553_05735 [Pyrinomonadaceae bacterium]|jgi:hypothetical protein